ncbi:ATP-binding protein [Actinoalloteichus caeruleus]|uniref:ATP-binding protein n=1 Tax=Actinoalloteichus cyanogriseus TaxID=2893586 RepID=UPI003AAC64AA
MRPPSPRRFPRAPTGLRGRLLITVVSVTVLGAIGAAWAGVQRSETALLKITREHRAEDLVSRVTQVAPSVRYPPDADALDQLRREIGENALVVYQDAAAGEGIFAAGAAPVPARLRETMDAQAAGNHGRVLTQRVEIDGTSWLVVGAPVMVTGPDGARSPSGIEVYSAHDLTSVREQVDALVRGAATTTAAMLPLAVLLALLASRSVLRPVARLRETAQRLARGELDARLEPTGVDELAQLTRTINEMAASLQNSMNSIAAMEEGSRRFAADVSHELRTPLTTLTAAVEVLQDVLSHAEASGASDEAEARESAHLAVTETRRLMELVEDIMEIARFDAGTAQLRWEHTDLVEVITACVRHRGWGRDVVISAPDAEDDRTLVADRRRVDVIVANLVGNALTHGGTPVRVDVLATDEGLTVRVTDRGPGIPEDVLPHVFSRFYKADASRSRTPGSGLGLAIARENALLHDGVISAANAPDGGAAFTLWLPRHPTRATGHLRDEEQDT